MKSPPLRIFAAVRAGCDSCVNKGKKFTVGILPQNIDGDGRNELYQMTCSTSRMHRQSKNSNLNALFTTNIDMMTDGSSRTNIEQNA
jgi:hypothetical protein